MSDPAFFFFSLRRLVRPRLPDPPDQGVGLAARLRSTRRSSPFHLSLRSRSGAFDFVGSGSGESGFVAGIRALVPYNRARVGWWRWPCAINLVFVRKRLVSGVN